MTTAPQAKRLSEDRLRQIRNCHFVDLGTREILIEQRAELLAHVDALESAAAAREEQGFKRGLEAAHEIADRWRANDLRNAEAMQGPGHEQADEALSCSMRLGQLCCAIQKLDNYEFVARQNKAAIEAEKREEQVRELVEAAKAHYPSGLDKAYRDGPTGSRLRAALAALTTGENDER